MLPSYTHLAFKARSGSLRAGSLSCIIIWQSSSMQRLHVQVELLPRAKHPAACGTGRLFYLLFSLLRLFEIISGIGIAALLNHYPRLINVPLHSMSYLAVFCHAIECGELLVAISAGCGANTFFFMHPCNMYLHISRRASIPTLRAYLSLGFTRVILIVWLVFVFDMFHCFLSS